MQLCCPSFLGAGLPCPHQASNGLCHDADQIPICWIPHPDGIHLRLSTDIHQLSTV